ncbi:replication initiation factor domain-containing protein [Enterococcus sp. BWR-S5]|uniref:replication initiation factor domain-containing protein n=1 Tax=Enterococcus sp. BWR-S5 TaxID=2787714 RepID=UPI00192265BB|nr:replication initiation factor domain-containing protein [Enterococcus sp. BWR-S5]MBL1224584.1 replication initiation factor domain-containing protein [Enterococcus sp. BWR-S5]MBL1224595.1 replication initiation factor domain-containing protein [Enterococcus sp. BWR-S5]
MKEISAKTKEVRYITLDFLTASFNLEMDVYEFINEILHMNFRDFIFESGGVGRKYHYGNTAKFEHIHVYYSTQADIENGMNSGITVNLSGQACRQFELFRWSDNRKWTWYNTIQELVSAGARFTRCDIAQDFINSRYTWQFLLEKIYKKTLIYRGNVKRYNKINTKTGTDFNASIYIGDKPQQLNIYDKKGERFDRAKEEYDVENWTRWELRLFGDKAHMAVLELADGRALADLWAGILSAHYRFVTLTGDKNRSRRDNAKWWKEFLNGAKETKLLIESDKPTLKKKENWLENHGPDKAELMLYMRDFFVYGADTALDTLLKRIQSQRINLTDSDIQMLLQGIIEEASHANIIIDKQSTDNVVKELHKCLFNEL